MVKFVSPYGATQRRNFVLGLLVLFAATVIGKVVYLQIYNADFLVAQGNSRFIRTKEEPAVRGTIFDRNNVPIAVSTPASSIWVNPQEILIDSNAIKTLATLLDKSFYELEAKIKKRQQSRFVYIARGLEPAIAKAIIDKKITGVYRSREYRRYYPSGDVLAQVIGYNNIDDKGISGIEQLYNDWLAGTPGSSEVMRDVKGKVVDVLEEITPPIQGKDLQLTIDKRLQYLTYVALLDTAAKFKPKSATAVMLDAKTSEVLAMVSIPSGNPNDFHERNPKKLKNRAITDTFEPGSVLKPFTIATALEERVVSPHTTINTEPGYFTLGKNTVRDVHNYGKRTVSGVIQKSSNVGTCKIALKLQKEKLHKMFANLGFGQKSQINFPGEQKGILRKFAKMSDFDYCTNSYGYGISANALQLANAYTIIANNGLKIDASLIKRDTQSAKAVRILSKRTAKQVRKMLKVAASEGGTGTLATMGDYMSDYTVGGKTGTVHKVINGKYAKHKYRSVFVGMAPIDNPKIVMAIVVDEPQGKKYYGGLVAAPVFAQVVGKSLRILGVKPDREPTKEEDKK